MCTPPPQPGQAPVGPLTYQTLGPHAATARTLRTISVFWFILGGISALFSLIPLIHVTIGVLMLSGSFSNAGKSPPEWFALAFIVLGLTFIAIGLGLSFCMMLVGIRLRQHRSRTFCVVVSALACTAFPFGTALGVWTLIVLCRPEAVRLFTA